MVVVGFLADKLFHEVRFGFAVFVLGPHYGGFEAEAEADSYAFHEGFGEGVFEAFVVEFCEEAEGAEGKGEDGGDDTLEEPAGVEDGSVASKLWML